VEVLSTLFSLVLVVFIVSMMLAAGLSATVAALGQVLRRFWLVLLVLIVNLVLIPLLGWGLAELFALTTPAYIALVLVACSPGGPFGAKAALIQRGDVVTAGALQILLAVVGSVTFPFTASWVLSAADLGESISIPVAELVRTVVILQLVPFVVGMAVRNWSPVTATGWLKTSLKVSNVGFFAVIVGALLGGWQEIVALFGDRSLLAAMIFSIVAIAIGTFVAVGKTSLRTTVGLIAPSRNAGPVFAAIGIAFANDPAILGATTAILLIGAVIGILFASFLGHARGQEAAVPAPAAASDTTSEVDVEL
jgi:BASS family bile acid:Na+ symporter